MRYAGVWKRFVAYLIDVIPITMLVVGQLLLTVKRYLLTDEGKIQAEAEPATSNRRLALSHQQKGQLDMAFDMYRKCPLDESIMDLLYNLGLEFEHKRLFNKAVAVYRYMGNYNANFRDIERRSGRARDADQTVIFDTGGRGT